MPHDHDEIEAQYEARYSVSAVSAPPPLQGLDGVDGSIHRSARTGLQTTSAPMISGWPGWASRLWQRTGAEDPGWHLAVPTAAAQHELHEPLTTDQAPPTALVEALAGVVRGRAFTPVLTLRTRRAVRRLRDAHGSVLAEVSDDLVNARSTPARCRRQAGRGMGDRTGRR
jgi:hypothetical protein